MEFAMRSRITAREQGHVVPERYELIDEPRNDPFCPTVEFRRNTFSQGGNLCDSHEPESKLRLSEIRRSRRTLLPQQEMADIMAQLSLPGSERAIRGAGTRAECYGRIEMDDFFAGLSAVVGIA
jgi:hypothetical protein